MTAKVLQNASKLRRERSTRVIDLTSGPPALTAKRSPASVSSVEQPAADFTTFDTLEAVKRYLRSLPLHEQKKKGESATAFENSDESLQVKLMQSSHATQSTEAVQALEHPATSEPEYSKVGRCDGRHENQHVQECFNIFSRTLSRSHRLDVGATGETSTPLAGTGDA